MAPTLIASDAAPVRLRFVKDQIFAFRQFRAGETPQLWFYPRDANALLTSGVAEIDADAATYEESLKFEGVEPPPLRTGFPHDAPIETTSPNVTPQQTQGAAAGQRIGDRVRAQNAQTSPAEGAQDATNVPNKT